MSIYLDCWIVVCVIERPPAYSVLIRALMQSAQAACCFSSFLNRAQRLDLTPAVSESAAAPRGLKPPAALRLAAALLHGCCEFWTNDERLFAVALNLARKVS